jgi:long-chain acyl-CoA synthetase
MPGYVGRAVPFVELRIDTPDARGIGEILVRSPAVMSGYWGRPDEHPVDRDGWLHTGDLGRLDDKGRLFVVDRLKDVIIRGGEKVAAPHVEECLRGHPGVAEVAVVGLPHGDLGEEVAAAVVPVPGVAVTADELLGHAERTLARYELPSAWWLRAEPLPVNLSGKVLKRQLRDSWPNREGCDP